MRRVQVCRVRQVWEAMKDWQKWAVVVPVVIFIVSGIMAYGQMRQEVMDSHERITRLENRFYDHVQERCAVAVR